MGDGGEHGLRLAVGTPCSLCWDRHRYPAEILGVSENTIWTSFPAIDVNAEDLGVDVQLGVGTEGPVYHTQVVIGPRERGDGVVLRRTASAVRKHGRDIWRVPTRLQARYGAGASAPWFNATIANLSLHGALLAGSTQFQIGDRIMLDVHFKDDIRRTFPAMVVHTAPPDQFKRSERQWLGVRFDGLDGSMRHDLTWYLWKRVHRLYPEEVRALYPRKSKRKKRSQAV